jgi:hypothetical protein
LDRTPGIIRFFGKSYFHGPSPASTYGRRPHRVRCVAILNENGLTARSVAARESLLLARRRRGVMSAIRSLSANIEFRRLLTQSGHQVTFGSGAGLTSWLPKSERR